METARHPRIRDNNKEIHYGEAMPDFDISKDYGDEYANVHFRVNAHYYKYPYGDYEGKAEAKELFSAETKELFEELGWEFILSNNSAHSNTVKKGKQELYLHPHDFSGEVLKNEIVTIHNALIGRKTFKYEAADVYDTIYDISDEELIKVLDTKRDEIEKVLLESFKTPCRTTFLPRRKTQSIADKFTIKRVGKKDDNMSIVLNYVHEVLNRFIDKGYIIKNQSDNFCGYRTINKIEQRKLKINLGV